MSSICACCRMPPKAGQRHPYSADVKYGAMKGTHPLCAACNIEVFTAVANMVEKGHTFEVLKNAVVNIQERIARRQRARRLVAAIQPCRPDGWRTV